MHVNPGEKVKNGIRSTFKIENRSFARFRLRIGKVYFPVLFYRFTRVCKGEQANFYRIVIDVLKFWKILPLISFIHVRSCTCIDQWIWELAFVLTLYNDVIWMLLRTTPQNALDHSKVSQQILAAFVVIHYFSIYHRYIFYPFYVRKDKKNHRESSCNAKEPSWLD